MTKLYFIRHAQSVHGYKDDRNRPLTSEAWNDLGVLLDFFKDKQIDEFYCSTYKRSIDTISEVVRFFHKEMILDERLRERVNGKADNTIEMIKKRWDDTEYHEPEGESISMVQKRNIEAVQEILRVNEGKTIGIGTHGTALSTILNYYHPEFGFSDFMRILDWMPYVIELDFEGQQLVSMQEHVHVQKEFRK